MASVLTTIATLTASAASAMGQDTAVNGIQIRNLDDTYNWLVGEDGETQDIKNGYAFNGISNQGNFSFSWNVTSTEFDLVQSVLAGFSITNTSSSSQSYRIYLTDLVSLPSSRSLVGGSIAGTVTDLNGDGASLSAIDGKSSIYGGFLDASNFDDFNGNVVGSLLTGDSIASGAFLTNTFSPESFGNIPALPGQAGPGIISNIGIMLAFNLSEGDTAAFTTSFVAQIPSPGPLALLLSGLLCMRGRARK
jgi:hypothetical protein